MLLFFIVTMYETIIAIIYQDDLLFGKTLPSTLFLGVIS